MIAEMVKCGYDVYLSLPDNPDNVYFEKMGCNIILTKIDRRGVNPFKDIQLLLSYRKIISSINPSIIFSFTIKPNIYGTLASNNRYKQICNITGTGATFLNNNIVSSICKILYKLSVKRCYKVFFQNSGDRDFFINEGLVRNNHALLPGSGCNLDEYTFKEMPKTAEIRFIFIGRVMKLKGIDQYIQAAKVITHKYPKTKFYIAGWNEQKEYKSLVANAHNEGWVEYIGFRKDINTWIEKCHCTILPSHGGEGVPNVLLESAAMGRVCIGSRINGTKDVIEDGITGFLFKTGDAKDLEAKIEQFINMSHEEKQAMGVAGRNKVEREFNRRIIVEQYLDEITKA